jgi:CrcB protein
MKVLLVCVAGALGAVSRYGIGVAVGVRSFPWATFGINLTGSFLLGTLVRLAADRDWPATTTVTLGVGFLGAFTTFSTFSVETEAMFRDNRPGVAALYVAASVVGGVTAAALGYALAGAAT